MAEETKSEVLKLIEKLTTNGRKSLEEDLMKKLKNICKSSNDYVNCAYYALMTQLRKNHSEIRYSVLLVMNELFCRSYVFKKLLESDVDEFLELVVETNPERPLPLPKLRAKELKIKGLEFMKAWALKCGVEFIRFKMALKFLEGCKKVDFNDMEARSAAERERQEREEERLERVMKEKVDRVKSEIQETRNEIYDVLTQMENCFRLIIPHPKDELFSSQDFEMPDEKVSIGNEEENKSDVNDNHLRHHGIYDMKKGITIEVDRNSEVAVNVNEDNQPVIENINDLHKQLNTRYYPLITKWLKILSKGKNCTDALKQSIDLKQQIESVFEKFKDLKIIPEDSNSGDEDEDDFIEVEEKEGYEDKPYVEPRIPNLASQPSCSKELSAAEKARLWEIKHSHDDVKDPTSAASTLHKRMKSFDVHMTPSCSSAIPKEEVKSKKSELLAKAPVLPYDIDLYHWEEEKPLVPEVVKFDSLHKFWESKDDGEENETLKAAQIASLRTRKIDFSGKFEPVKWSCRAPLPSGKLCPRKDRIKCPFHGKIIKRDSTGTPVNKNEDPATSSSSTQETPTVPEWQDPALLRDIEAATGIDLKIPEKRGKGSKGKNKKLKSGLTNINVPQTNARDRLKKKIMKRYKHYAKKLDDVERKLFNDKFGDQWNYY